MSTRTLVPKARKPAAPPSTRTIRLTERTQLTKGRVDAEAGIIFDVKILGHSSDNKRIYTPQSMKAAIPLYEGRFVNIDHPDKPLAQRSSLDRTAWLENVRYVDGDGLRGDLHFLLPLDDYQQKVIWAAEHKPNAWGLSHNADGKGEEDRQGRFVVAAITEVRSVDLVPEPATNRSLFESQPMQTTLRQLIEASKAPAATKTGWLRLLEDEFGDMPMDAPPEPAAAAPAGDGNSLLAQAIAAFITAGSAPDHEMATKLLKLMKPESAETPAETTTEGEGDDDEKKKKEDEKKMESAKSAARAPGAIILTEAKAKQFCSLAGLDPAKEKLLLEAMTASTEDVALKLLEVVKAKTAPARSNGVRAQGPIGLQAPGTGTVAPAKSLDEFKRCILRR